AFCGGIDFNEDRLKQVTAVSSSSGGVGQPLHDVHCLVRGTAAIDLLRTFVQRWVEFPQPDPSGVIGMLKGAGDALEKLIPGSVGDIVAKLRTPLIGTKIVTKAEQDDKNLIDH